MIFERLRTASGCSELYRVHTYRGFRSASDGRPYELRIDVHDGGAVSHPRRWYLMATEVVPAGEEREPRIATGNPEPTLEMAIAGTHWAELDRPS